MSTKKKQRSMLRQVFTSRLMTIPDLLVSNNLNRELAKKLPGNADNYCTTGAIYIRHINLRITAIHNPKSNVPSFMERYQTRAHLSFCKHIYLPTTVTRNTSTHQYGSNLLN